jgi:hypothetical protein
MKRVQLVQFLDTQLGCQAVVHAIQRGARDGGHLAAIRGEAKQLLAAVAGVPPPAEQTTALQFVKRCDDRGTTDPKRRSKALLGAGFNG